MRAKVYIHKANACSLLEVGENFNAHNKPNFLSSYKEGKDILDVIQGVTNIFHPWCFT